MAHLALIDGSAYAHRAFHAAKDLRTPTGQPVGAVLVFGRLMRALLRDLTATHAMIAWDAGRSGWRSQIFADYKANRQAAAPDLAAQLPIMREAASAFGLASERIEAWEADDIIATHATMALDAGAWVTIHTHDKDMLQLVGERCHLVNPQTGEALGVTACRAKFGVEPHQVPDAQGLIGDTTDNIPGVPGIGPKGAASLINTYGDLETLYSNVASVRPAALSQRLDTHKAQAFTSRALARLATQTPVDVGQDLRWRGIDHARAAALFESHALTGLAAEIEQAQPPA